MREYPKITQKSVMESLQIDSSGQLALTKLRLSWLFPQTASSQLPQGRGSTAT